MRRTGSVAPYIEDAKPDSCVKRFGSGTTRRGEPFRFQLVFSREWKSTGGGALLRIGDHSVGACLRLKQWEGEYRLGRSIRPVSVLADTADLIHTNASERARKANAHQWISSDPVDVEDWANVTIRFDDGSRATVLVSDVGLGGLNTRVTAYMTDGVIKANMTANDTIETYAVDPATFNDEYFTEKLETKAGWNHPSCDEDWFRRLSKRSGISSMQSGMTATPLPESILPWIVLM